ncbi:mitogen-activated protein kinase kinase kinase 1-like isoform X2 [Watersipora subatra]|uniref:mitogen-activated protein kinase kinase kinase 1-like isoform X2 n=1 Tax=Watersipora subatra TaxID=2589382 RepID=UPI00355BE714
MEKRPKSGPLVARHSFNKTSSLRLDTNIAQSSTTKGGLRPTSDTYESAFQRQVVNRPHSPGALASSRRVTPTNSFNKGSKRPGSPHAFSNPEEIMKRRIEKAKKAKLYLLQQAGPNTFIIGGGESQDQRHKVTIGPQLCSCGKGFLCAHILFVMVRVFELATTDPRLQSKVLKNFEVETLFRKYESRRKQRLSRSSASHLPASSSAGTELPDAAACPNSSTTELKMVEPTCPICLLDLSQTSQHLVHCESCHNKLHNDCMAIWYQLVKKQAETLTCPLCRSVWPNSNTISFNEVSTDVSADTNIATSGFTASPNSLGTSPVSGFVDIEPTTLLPRGQPIPEELTAQSTTWVEMFGEDLIGCLFMKNEWVMRETALRHLSRETIMLLSNPSEEDLTSLPASQSASDGSSTNQSRIEYVLETGCQILAMMMADPVYKVYVASLRALRTMLCYCSLPGVSKLRLYMKPVIQSIILKCADGNRKTNQLSMSTLCEFAKDQEGELAIGRELNIEAQTGLGGCMYVLECCICSEQVDSSTIQWLNGRLLVMNQLLEEHYNKFSVSNVGELAFGELSQKLLFPMLEFAVMALTRPGNKTKTVRCAKKVVTHCTKLLTVMPGMNSKIKGLLSELEPNLRGRLERLIIENSHFAQQAAIQETNSRTAMESVPDISEPRAGSPSRQDPKRGKHRRPLVFGSLYQAPLPKERLVKSHSTATDSTASKLPRHKGLLLRRSDSYTEAVYINKGTDNSKGRSYVESSGIPAIRLSRQESSSTESVEADLVVSDHVLVGSPCSHAADAQFTDSDQEERELCSDEQVEDMIEDADVTLTECPEFDEVDGLDMNRRSPTKLLRGRVVSGKKPRINIRGDTDNEEGRSDSCDVVDGLSPRLHEVTDETVSASPTLLSYRSMGFDTQGESLSPGAEFDSQKIMHPQSTDSDTGTDNISGSVSLSVSPVSSEDEGDESSDNDCPERPHKSAVPFGGYRRARHTRSKTDPFKMQKTKSPSSRYHSDPTGADSTTSSSASTPRSPPRAAYVASVSTDVVTVSTAGPSEIHEVDNGRPTSRAITSRSTTKRHLPSRPQSVRAARGAGSQLPVSRLPSRAKTSANVAPIPCDSVALAALSSSARRSHEELPSKDDRRDSASPPIPAAIRALTPPNSPLKARKNSTPVHSPPSSPSISRSVSPPQAPMTAVVRPQANYACVAPQTKQKLALTPQPREHKVQLSHPVQRQTSVSNIEGRVAASASSSSDDHKIGVDALIVEELSDSAGASPYEKEVSFKSEVALFSPRSSGEIGNCHCKDEVELEEAIALAKAMEISQHQIALPQVPGLSTRRQEETITIHVQPDQTDAKGSEVEYLEDIHWKRGMMIGTGAFSTCYQCRDVMTGIIMAVKQISFCRNSDSEQDTICKAVIDEIRMMATLNHSNIVRILGATQTGAHFNMFVEWMPGGSVSHLLERYGSFSEPVITSYTQQVLMGLAYLHDHQILHRDMKGANLLVDSTGKHLRIGDFGACAQLASSMTGAGELKGQLLGTIAFMAPEVLRGEHYGRGCDVWSVGCVIIEMVTTKPPWNASNVSNHLKLIFTIASANTSPPIPDNLPPGIKDIMLRCLETESKNRPPAKELLQHPLFTRSHYRRR